MSKNKYKIVKEVMSADLLIIDGLTVISDALDMMRKHKVSSLVINRRNESDEYGLLTASDIATEVVVPDKALERTSAYQVMQKPVLSLRANMNVRYAIRLFSKFKVSRALVIENDEAIGIVTLRDMLLRHTEVK